MEEVDFTSISAPFDSETHFLKLSNARPSIETQRGHAIIIPIHDQIL